MGDGPPGPARPSPLRRVAGAVRDPREARFRLATRLWMAWLALLNRWRRRSVLGSADVTVNLTTYGHRIPTVFYAIESIARGRARPSRLILWLDDATALARPPAALRRLQKRGLEILPTPDYGPHKKQFPYASSRTDHTGPLIVCDDDTLYPRWWLEGLVRAHQEAPDHLHGYRAHRMALDDDGIGPYSDWVPAESGVASFRVFATGMGGVLLPPAVLDALRAEGDAFLQAAPRADDVWVHAVAVRAGVRTNQVPAPSREFRQIPGTQRSTLYGENVRRGGNDAQIQQTYGPADVARIRADAAGGGSAPSPLPLLLADELTPPAARRPPSLADNMLITFLGNLLPPMALIITGPIVANALGVFGRGQVAAGQAPLGLVTTLVTFGIQEALTYAVAVSPVVARYAARRAALVLAITGAFGTLGIISLSGVLSQGNADTQRLIVIASFAVIPSLLIGVARGIAAATQQWKLIALERASASFLRLALIVALAATGRLTPLAATLVVAATPLFGALAYLRLPARIPPKVQGEVHEAARLRNLLGYGTRIWIGSLSGILLLRVDQTLMSALTTADELGLYVVAVSLGELPLMINSAVRDVTFATDAAERRDDRLAASARISSAASAVAGLGLGIAMVWLLPLLYGEDFRPAVPVAAVLLVAVVLGTPGSIGGAGLSARGRPGLRSASLLIACILNIGLVFLLVPRFGALGAAWATLVGNLVSANLNLLFLQRISELRARDFYGLRGTDVRTAVGFLERTVLGRALRLIPGRGP